MIPIIAVQLGRIGDILNIMPAMKYLGIRHMLVNPEFGFVLKGQSYIEPVFWDGDMENLRAAVGEARNMADIVLVPQLFGRDQPDFLPARTRPSFVQDQWDRLAPGLGDRWGSLPLEFDQRDPERELDLLRSVGVSDKPCLSDPMILVNLFSHSSPVAADYAQALMTYLRERRANHFIVDLSSIRATAYCDLLGLYERAAGIITADTATLHLCRACPNLPTFRFVRRDHDATPIREFEACQYYDERGFGKIDKFIASLKGAS
jgi:hypothetical protein